MDKDAKIYVAGHAGMVGSAIVRELRRRGYGNIVTRTHSELDLCRQDAVERFFAEERPRYVIDAAAKVGGIAANAREPAEFLYDNTVMEMNLIHSAYLAGVEKFEFLGSSCIYPRLAPQPMKEEYLLTSALETTNEGYALAKIAGLKYCEYLNRERGAKFISVIPANAYGPGDSFDPEHCHVIPALIMKCHSAVKNGGSVTLWGTGAARREFIHTRDIASACVFLLENYSAPEPVNVGTGEEITMLELARTIAGVTGYTGEILTDPSKPDGMPRRVCDNGRLLSMGWQPSVPLKEGLAELYSLYLETTGE